MRLSMDGTESHRVKTLCPSGLSGWTQVPLAQAAWVQIPQLSGRLGPCSRVLLGAARHMLVIWPQGGQALRARAVLLPSFTFEARTVCPSGLRGWTQVPLAQAAWAQIPQLSIDCIRSLQRKSEAQTRPGLCLSLWLAWSTTTPPRDSSTGLGIWKGRSGPEPRHVQSFYSLQGWS